MLLYDLETHDVYTVNKTNVEHAASQPRVTHKRTTLTLQLLGLVLD